MNSGTPCQVDFYLLGSASLSPQRLACKLALMAWERGHTISVVTAGPRDAESLDKLMWEYPEGRFLPHDCHTDHQDSPAPIRILQSPPQAESDVVINLTGDALPQAQLFSRLLEIVPFADEDRQASRQKYRSYAEQGFKPSTHEIN